MWPNGVGEMIITRRSKFTGALNMMDLDITQEQLDEWLDGALIQDVMPELNDEEREFLITGATKEEWESIFGGENDE